MKKAQFEIMGLAIIVVLVAFATLFFFIAFAEDDQTNSLGEFESDQYTQNFVDVLRKTSLAECPGTWGDYFKWTASKQGPYDAVPETLCADEFSSGIPSEGIDEDTPNYNNFRGVHLLKDLLDAATQYKGEHYFFQYRQANSGASPDACQVYDARTVSNCNALITLHSTDPTTGENLCDISDPTINTGKAGQTIIVLRASPRETAQLVLFLCKRT